MYLNLINSKIILKSRPDPSVTEDLFDLKTEELKELKDDELLVDVKYVSVDPAMRGWISDVGNYSKPVAIDETMRSLGVGKIISSKDKGFNENEYVVGWLGWQKYAVVNKSAIQIRVNPNEVPLSANLGALGLNGITAFAGLVDICKPKKKETIVVTTAAGSVGSAVGQIAKIYGCNTIGFTSSDEKAEICKTEFGYDEVINYKKTDNLSSCLKQIAPNGIDCFFDNVGGDQFDAVMENVNINARVVICGTIGMPSYPIPNGPRVNRTLLVKRAKIEGLLVLDYFNRYKEIYDQLAKWFKDGKLKNKEDISHGLSKAPSSLVKILNGLNLGKKLVKL